MAYLALFLAMVLVGVNVPTGKTVVAHLPIFLFLALRCIVACALLIPVLVARGELKRPTSVQLRDLAIQAFFGVFLFSLFMLWGVEHTSGMTAGIITSTIPAAVVLLSFLFLRERLGAIRLLAVVLSIAGVAILSVGPGIGTGQGALLGNLLVVAAVFCEALFVVIGKRAVTGQSPLAATMWLNLLALGMCLPMGAWQMQGFDPLAIDPSIWVIALYYSVTASVLGFSLWFYGVSHVDAGTAGVFTGIIPLAALAASMLMLGETPVMAHLAGLAAVLMSILLGVRADRRRPAVA